MYFSKGNKVSPPVRNSTESHALESHEFIVGIGSRKLMMILMSGYIFDNDGSTSTTSGSFMARRQSADNRWICDFEPGPSNLPFIFSLSL